MGKEKSNRKRLKMARNRTSSFYTSIQLKVLAIFTGGILIVRLVGVKEGSIPPSVTWLNILNSIHIKRINKVITKYISINLKSGQNIPSSGVFPQIQWDFLVLLSDVCLNFQGPGLLENAGLRVQQLSVTVSDNYRDKKKKKKNSLKLFSNNNK